MNQSSSTPPQHFAVLPDLPDDLEQAIESLKLAILRHQFARWREVSADHVINRLCLLISLALSAPPRPGGSNSGEGGQ